MDRNEIAVYLGLLVNGSPSSRRAWIEIQPDAPPHCAAAVALLAEGVDRNIIKPCYCDRLVVALLAEGVDRNLAAACLFSAAGVALLAEGVDRNCMSLAIWPAALVALLAEGVDRNFRLGTQWPFLAGRPPRGGRG